MKKQIINKITVASLFALFAAVCVFVPLSGSAHADSDSDRRTYMQIYSEQGTYAKVKIHLSGVSDDSHSCGGDLTASNGYTLVRRIPKTRAAVLRCSPVGGGAAYSVSFIKGKSADSQAVLPVNNIDVDANKCMVVKPHGGAANATTTSRCPSSGADTVTKHTVATKMCVNGSNNNCQTNNIGISANRGPSGRISFYEDNPIDGDQNVSRYFCSGSITYQYKNVSTGALQGPYSAKLRFATGTGGLKDHCTARFGNDPAKFTSKTNYAVIADLPANTYLNHTDSNASGASPSSFTTK